MDLEQTAIERLKMASDMSLRLYKQPLVITYSGGKDSDVLLHLAGAAGIPYEVLHSLTTADAPETVWHVRETFRRLELAGVPCDIDKHKQPDGTYMTMWRLIPLKLVPPTRIMRYCCAALREKVPKWISVEDRLPEPGVPVLVNYIGTDELPSADGVVAWTDWGALWWEGSLADSESEVTVPITHWMPLPPGPKECAK